VPEAPPTRDADSGTAPPSLLRVQEKHALRFIPVPYLFHTLPRRSGIKNMKKAKRIAKLCLNLSIEFMEVINVLIPIND